jgi:hypothetical protein
MLLRTRRTPAGENLYRLRARRERPRRRAAEQRDELAVASIDRIAFHPASQGPIAAKFPT